MDTAKGAERKQFFGFVLLRYCFRTPIRESVHGKPFCEEGPKFKTIIIQIIVMNHHNDLLGQHLRVGNALFRFLSFFLSPSVCFLGSILVGSTNFRKERVVSDDNFVKQHVRLEDQVRH